MDPVPIKVMLASIKCPICGAEPGEKCVSAKTGKLKGWSSVHAKRARKSYRAWKKAYDDGRSPD